MALPAKIKLTYFGGPGGRAEPARLALTIAGIDFEDDRITFEDWMARKPGTPSGAVPVLEVTEADGTVSAVTQSSAILRYIGKLTGHYPTDPLLALKVDEMDQMVEELAMRTVISTAHLTGEERLEGRKKLADNKDSVAHFWISKINDRLAESDSGFAIGDSLTVADLRIFCELTAATSGFYDGFGTHDPMDTEEGGFWTPYDAVKKHRLMVATLPPVTNYYQRPDNADPMRAFFLAVAEVYETASL
jgi:glutathione S-transferase